MLNHYVNHSCYNDDILFGRDLGPDDFDTYYLRSTVPEKILTPWIEQTRWRFFDRPERDCDGVVLLLPPVDGPGEVNGWKVYRYFSMLGKVALPPAGPDDIAFLGDPGQDAREVYRWLEQHADYSLDMSRTPLPELFEQHSRLFVEDLRRRLEQAGLTMDDTMAERAGRRELSLMTNGRSILCEILETSLTYGVHEANIPLTPAVYNWLSFAEDGTDWPERQRRLAALQYDPPLVSRYAWVTSHDESPDDPILFLNFLLWGEDERVCDVVDLFRATMAEVETGALEPA